MSTATEPCAPARTPAPAPLQTADEEELFRSFLDRDPGTLLASLAALPPAHPSRPRLRERVIEAWLPLAHHLARRYGDRSEPIEDLRQVAAIGLIKSVDRYDPTVGVDFVAFAVPTISGEIKRHFRDYTWHLHVRRGIKDRLADFRRSMDELQQQLHRTPTVAELAAHLNVSEEQVTESLCAAQAYRSTPLQRQREPGDEVELGDLLPHEERGYDLAEHRPALAAALAAMDERSREIIRLRFFGDLTQQQIADRIGVSQMQISRILTKVTADLRDALAVTA
jgi:RNA polymerase sigma-B factor